MIQTYNDSKTISGFFGISDTRKDELIADFEKLFKTQSQEVIDDFLNRLKAIEDINKIHMLDNVKILSEFLLIAKTPAEQLFCIYHGARQIVDYRERIEAATKQTALAMLFRK